MYHTPAGDRVLLGAERRFFEESLGMIVDMLSEGDAAFGVAAFDELQLGQKLVALCQVGRALVLADEPVPELTAYLEATVAVVYEFALGEIESEIENAEPMEPSSLRSLALNAIGECGDLDELPEVDCKDIEEWQFVIECLQDRVLWDNDYEMRETMDADPGTSRRMKHDLGITDDYFVEVPEDVADSELNRYLDALRGLTPRGRG